MIPLHNNYLYTDTDNITVQSTGNKIEFSVGGWLGTFQAMDSVEKIEHGYYPGLHRYPFHNPVKGGIGLTGNGRGCNKLSGWFVVDHVEYAQNTLIVIDLRFEQHCEG
jgi:hypothetical protein